MFYTVGRYKTKKAFSVRRGTDEYGRVRRKERAKIRTTTGILMDQMDHVDPMDNRLYRKKVIYQVYQVY